jgi:hypothetical protein
LAAWLLVTAWFAAPAVADEWQFDDVGRVVALSDIHGAYTPMLRTLRAAAVIGDGDEWVAGSTHLVIVGDITDRGPESRQVMDLLMQLEKEAESAGGKVHVLIGNHEAMNLVSDLRYVSRAEYAAFAEEERAEDRQRWFEQFVEKRVRDDKSREELAELFERSFPPGFFAHRRAFGPTGKYGSWLLGKPIIVVINGTAFVHGGVSPMVGELGLEGVNGTLRGEMLQYVEVLETLYAEGILLPTDNFYNHPKILADFIPPLDTDEALLQTIAVAKVLHDSRIHESDGPLWYRGNASCSELVEADQLESVLASIGAERVVIGHTPTYGRRIYQRYGGTVIEVDTGMLADYYNGSGNAVVIQDDAVAAINESNPEPQPIAAAPRQVGQRPAGYLEAGDIEVLLANGEILATLSLPSAMRAASSPRRRLTAWIGSSGSTWCRWRSSGASAAPRGLCSFSFPAASTRRCGQRRATAPARNVHCRGNGKRCWSGTRSSTTRAGFASRCCTARTPGSSCSSVMTGRLRPTRVSRHTYRTRR